MFEFIPSYLPPVRKLFTKSKVTLFWNYLQISFRLKATTNEAACALYKKFTQISTGRRELCKDIYAYNFRQEVAHTQRPPWIKDGAGGIKDSTQERNELSKEFQYLGYDSKKWRVTEANDQFKLCRTYPQYLVVPSAVSDEELHRVHNGRFFSRFPVAVWRCKSSGAVLLRSAQPTISWLGAANEDDLRYIDTIYNSVPSSSGGESFFTHFFLISVICRTETKATYS